MPCLEEDPDILEKKRELEVLQEELRREEAQRIAHEQRKKETERLQMLGELAEKEKDLEQRLEMPKQRKGLDLCIVMDATSSMEPYIKQCQHTILKLFEDAKNFREPVRIAFMAYRDVSDEIQFEWMDFQEDGGDLDECIATVKAEGGGEDAPENIAGAFKRVESFAWKSEKRLIFHVADAACHGKKYHYYARDDHEEGDPNGYNPEESMKFFARNCIDYCFWRLTSDTIKMCDIFEGAYREEVGEVGIFREVERGGDLDLWEYFPFDDGCYPRMSPF